MSRVFPDEVEDAEFSDIRHRLLLGYDSNDDPQYFHARKGDTARWLVVGPSGTGKTKLMSGVCRQIMSMHYNPALIVIDPKPTQDLYLDVVSTAIEEELTDRLYFFDPSKDYFPGYNPMERNKYKLHFQTVKMRNAMLKAWGQENATDTPLIATTGYNVCRTLIEAGLCLTEAPYLSDPKNDTYRNAILARIQTPSLQAAWNSLYSKGVRYFERRTELLPFHNRILPFIQNDLIKTMLGQDQKVLDLDSVINDGGIFSISLPIGLNLDRSDFALLSRLIIDDVVSRVLPRPKGSRPVFLVIDEAAQVFGEDIGDILDMGRSAGLNVVMGFQNLSQMSEQSMKVFASALTNCNIKTVFGGVSAHDLEILGPDMFMGMVDPYRVKQEIYHASQWSVPAIKEELQQIEEISDYEKRAKSETEKSNIRMIERYTTERTDTEIVGGDTISRTTGSSSGESDTKGTGIIDELLGETPRPDIHTDHSSDSESETYTEKMPEYRIAQSESSTMEIIHGEQPEKTKSEEQGVQRTRRQILISRMGEDRVPFIQMSSREFLSLSEQHFLFMQKMKGLPQQWFTVQTYNDDPKFIKAKTIYDPDMGDSERDEELHKRMEESGVYTTQEESMERKEERLRQLAQESGMVIDIEAEPSDDKLADEESWKGTVPEEETA